MGIGMNPYFYYTLIELSAETRQFRTEKGKKKSVPRTMLYVAHSSFSSTMYSTVGIHESRNLKQARHRNVGAVDLLHCCASYSLMGAFLKHFAVYNSFFTLSILYYILIIS